VATATRAVKDQRAVMRFEAEHRLASGRYTLVVTAVAADGAATSERRRVTLR
jgi:methionine-rich copper-binding protein CopC